MFSHIFDFWPNFFEVLFTMKVGRGGESLWKSNLIYLIFFTHFRSNMLNMKNTLIFTHFWDEGKHAHLNC